MYKEILENLLSIPQRGQIKIGFDLKKKVFRLSAPIFSSKKLPGRIRDYVEARKNFAFKPHATSYVLDQNTVFLVQEISFSSTGSRGDVNQFCHLSRHCHKMLLEIAAEETYKNALRI